MGFERGGFVVRCEVRWCGGGDAGEYVEMKVRRQDCEVIACDVDSTRFRKTRRLGGSVDVRSLFPLEGKEQTGRQVEFRLECRCGTDGKSAVAETLHRR